MLVNNWTGSPAGSTLLSFCYVIPEPFSLPPLCSLVEFSFPRDLSSKDNFLDTSANTTIRENKRWGLLWLLTVSGEPCVASSRARREARQLGFHRFYSSVFFQVLLYQLHGLGMAEVRALWCILCKHWWLSLATASAEGKTWVKMLPPMFLPVLSPWKSLLQ